MTETLVDRIYEAAFTPEAWPDVLDELAKIADARGGHVTVVSAKGVSFKGLGLLADADQKAVASNCAARSKRIPCSREKAVALVETLGRNTTAVFCLRLCLTFSDAKAT
jgi:hypothetical protein